MDPEVQRLIDTLGLQPHPEGGFFKETYRSAESIARAALPKRYGADRSHSTAIYYLLPSGARSRIHRVKSDEMWHFYSGGPLKLVQLRPDAAAREIFIGRDHARGQTFQHLVPAGSWFGDLPMPGSVFSFVGCTVAPGFDFADFEFGDRDKLIKLFPRARKAIASLTEPST